jgi:hypothetical protein
LSCGLPEAFDLKKLLESTDNFFFPTLWQMAKFPHPKNQCF